MMTRRSDNESVRTITVILFVKINFKNFFCNLIEILLQNCILYTCVNKMYFLTNYYRLILHKDL